MTPFVTLLKKAIFMILNSDSVELIRINAQRLANSIKNKDDLIDLATASSFEQVFTAMETILTNTEMFFDDELFCQLNPNSWHSFKGTLLVYTLNIVNRNKHFDQNQGYNQKSNHNFGATALGQ